MPLATPLEVEIGRQPSFEKVVDAVKGIAKALAELHTHGISHRDIKPDNLFFFNGNWVVGDFGLADFEGKTAQTATMEKVGPAFYIAPEMLNSANKADGKAADVYSLAKTLWVLGTGQRYPVPGHQLAGDMQMALSTYASHPRAALLDKLIESSTSSSPTARPTMAQFYNELEAWTSTPSSESGESNHDMSPYRRLLEGRLSKQIETGKVRAQIQEASARDGLRMRELFRPVANELRKQLDEAGFHTPNLQIDSYHYGFEIHAAVPFLDEDDEIHKLRILTHTLPPDCSRPHFHIETWWYYVRIFNNLSSEQLIWECNWNFLGGGSNEELQVQQCKRALLDQLPAAIEHVLSRAGMM
jgi:serine/threonine protein kinase